MQMVYDLLKISIPAILVVYAVYLTMRSFVNKQLEEYRLTLKQKNTEIVTPLRLQAFERVCLLLERVSPNQLIPRLLNREMSASVFQVTLTEEIRNEYHHNLSQQVYVSEDSWYYVSSAIEQLVSLVNEAGNEMSGNAMAIDLAKAVLEKTSRLEQDPMKNAISVLKKEIKELF